MGGPSLGVTFFAPTLNPGGERQLESLVRRAGFTMGQFALTRNQIPSGTRCIVALGNEALRVCTGEDGIMRHRGRVLPGCGAWVVPTFDPAFLLPKRGEESSSKYVLVVINDLRKAVQVAKEGFTRTPVTYLLDPSPERAWAFVQECEAANPAYLCPDIETTGKMSKAEEDEIEDLDFSIQRVGYAFRPHYAMSIPWMGPWMEIHRALLESQRTKTTWNGKLFDGPVLQANGITLNGDHHDAMWCWHTFMPNLPKKLEFVSSFCTDLLAWKHTAKSNFAHYNCCDVDSNLQIMLWLESVMRAQVVPEYLEVAA